MTTEKFDQWCILEIMGHQRFAGRVTEQAVGGASFVRIDVPEAPGLPAFTKLFGAGSVYCMTPVTEEVARQLARSFRKEPMSVYDLPDEIRERLKTPAVEHVPPNGDDDHWDDNEDDGYEDQ